MDLRKVKTLIDLVQQSDISELEIQEGEERVRISRRPVGGVLSPVVQQYAMPVSGGAAAAPEVVVPAEPQGYVLKSPMVGTFYRASTPSDKPFVEVGQTVKSADSVCIIEAMKLLNEIEAGHDGVIKEVLVENGQPVEYGQPLMVIV